MSSIKDYLRKPGIAAVFALATPLYANAATLPPPNVITTVTYNDFLAYSLELLEKCKTDTRCQPASDDLDKIGGGPGPIDNEVVILSSSPGGPVNNNFPALGGLGDNPFPSPTGDGDAFVMNPGNEPTPTFTGDRVDSWDVQLGALTDWLFGNDLVFLLNNNQSGDSINQWLQVWAQVKIYDDSAVPVEQACFEFSNGADNSGCKAGEPNLVLVTDPTYDFSDNAGDYVGAFTGYCVDKVGGAAFNLGGAGNDGDCVNADLGWDGYYVSGNLGNFADNAIFSQALNDYIYGVVADETQREWTLSLDLRLANNTNGGEYVWISNQFGTNIPPPPPPVAVPAPDTLFLLGAGLLALGTMRRRKSRASQ